MQFFNFSIAIMYDLNEISIKILISLIIFLFQEQIQLYNMCIEILFLDEKMHIMYNTDRFYRKGADLIEPTIYKKEAYYEAEKNDCTYADGGGISLRAGRLW